MKRFAVFLSIASFLLYGYAPQHRIEGLYSPKYVYSFGDMIIFYPDNWYLISNNSAIRTQKLAHGGYGTTPSIFHLDIGRVEWMASNSPP